MLWIFTLSGQPVFSQHVSRNNYTGAWETPDSWDPTWAFPQTDINPYDIAIYGYITVNGSLSFTGTSDLIIHDTLVILGDLFLGNNSDLTINDNGILIVRGNLAMHNHSEILADGYLIITGYIDKHGPNHEGSLTSNDDPAKVFVGGSIFPGDLTDNEHDYPALNCTAPVTARYQYTNCSYGNMTDLENDPIYSFFQHTCTITDANSNSPVCSGNTIDLTSSGGTGYNWTGPDGFTSNMQNPSIPNADSANSGAYVVAVTSTTGCVVTDTTHVIVNALPLPILTGPTPVSEGAAGKVYTTEAGMSNYIWAISTGGTITAGGGVSDNTITITWTTAGTRTVSVSYTSVTGCTAKIPKTLDVTVNPLPVPALTGPTKVCLGVTGNIYATEADMKNYLWTVSAEGTITAGGETGSNSVTITWTTAGEGTVAVNYTNVNGDTATSPTTYHVTVDALPSVSITSSSIAMCLNDTRTLTGSPTGGTFIISDGTGTIDGNILSATQTGTIQLTYDYNDVCANEATQSIIVNDNPVAIPGPDQELKYVFETEMQAELSPPETGEWSFISGSGHIDDIHSPTTRVTGLSSGENKFLWKVWNGNCEASAEVKITVYDLFIPSVITPNGDNKNDYFKISEVMGKVELIIFNRWGNEEYSNGNYSNDWDGRNNKGLELSNDTYFYILKFENGTIKKGSVLIKR